MKKTILAFALMGCGMFAIAQEDSLDYNTMNNANNRTTLQSSTSSYNAYSTTTNVPSTTQTFLIRDYPSATNATWEQSGNWYRATYLNNNRNMQVYYSPDGNNYSVALPVIQSWVPEDVVTSALTQYGNNIYAVNKVRGANGQEVYQVTLLDNGEARSEYLNADGSSVTAMEVFRVPGVEMMNMSTSNSNAAYDMSHPNDVMVNDSDNSVFTVDNGDTNLKTKTKIKNADGTEIKTKTKNGKTIVKQ